MIVRSSFMETAFVLITSLQLIIIVHSSAISPAAPLSPSTSNDGEQNGPSQQQQQQQQQQQKQIPSTTAPPILLTTSVQDSLNYANPMKQQQGTKQQQQHQHHHHHSEGTKQRSASNNDEHDPDMVPLATVNNHSRNQQAALRPPQYVDVSALIGQRNSFSASSSVNSSYGQQQPASGATSGPVNPLNSNSIVPNSVLSPKSRSGLPECATQQVCNAIFVRMNHTQRLCECSANYNWKCSNNLDPQDGHTIELTRKFDKRIYTQIKTCEPLREVRACKSPTDWTLLALQSERSGKAHYVVVCKCPTWAQLDGPYTHNHPPYANIPGIRVYGMLCAHQTARSSSAQTYAAYNPALGIYPDFPWIEALNVLNTTNLANTLDSVHTGQN